MKPTIYKVDVTKDDGMKSIYFVLATSLGGAEETVLREVYAAKFAIAEENKIEGIKPDLISKGATIYLADEFIKGMKS